LEVKSPQEEPTTKTGPRPFHEVLFERSKRALTKESDHSKSRPTTPVLESFMPIAALCFDKLGMKPHTVQDDKRKKKKEQRPVKSYKQATQPAPQKDQYLDRQKDERIVQPVIVDAVKEPRMVEEAVKEPRVIEEAVKEPREPILISLPLHVEPPTPPPTVLLDHERPAAERLAELRRLLHEDEISKLVDPQ
jgi:hypothetical protein